LRTDRVVALEQYPPGAIFIKFRQVVIELLRSGSIIGGVACGYAYEPKDPVPLQTGLYDKTLSFSNNQGPPVTDICAATPDRNVEIFKSLWVRVFFSLVFFAQNGSFILDTMVFLFFGFFEV